MQWEDLERAREALKKNDGLRELRYFEGSRVYSWDQFRKLQQEFIERTKYMNSVQVKVAEQIAEISPRVETKVVDVLVVRELDRRSNALVQVIDQLAKLEQDQRKLGPDQVTYNDKGEKATETYSKQRTEERKKLTDKITKYTNTINKALEKGDFKDVYNLANNKGGDTKPSDDQGEDQAEG